MQKATSLDASLPPVVAFNWSWAAAAKSKGLPAGRVRWIIQILVTGLKRSTDNR